MPLRTLVFGFAAISFGVFAHASGTSCEQLKGLALSNTAIEGSVVPAGDFKNPAAAWMPAIALPAHCRVRGTIKPTADSDIKFEVWLPLQQWNGKLQGSDNGGFAGSINLSALALSVKRGYAGVSTDTGHVASVAEDASWAKGHPEKLVDFAHRAIHLMTVNAKAIVNAFYGEEPKRSYFAGCSNGGRQALMTAQRYPDDYDGIIAGAPAHDWTRLMMSFASNAKALSAPDAFIPGTMAPVIQAAVNEQCDAIDGVKDGLVAAPQSCAFNPEKLVCSAGKTEGCLKPAQVEALQAIYRGPHTTKGVRLYPGFPAGAEVGAPLPGMGWDGWIFGKEPGDSMQARFALNFMRYIAMGDEGWQVTAFDPDRDAASIDARFAPLMNATDPNLSRFAARGGKLILFHGMADAAIPVGSSMDYFEAVGRKMGGPEREKFVRMFLVPGMQHCLLGPGPSVMGGTGAAVQPPDPSTDLSAALETWVEQGKPPESVRAIKPKQLAVAFNEPRSAGVERSGLICAYPKRAKWNGAGAATDAASYTCVAEK
ncbi:putative esterase [Steroidobacter agaridevorans]|uniref:Putative esterase n=1 Tax=Steroidobacter agaridevorans TaxID=2695856 RepID=A0A829YHZ4_9GAMM|nr:tannase/feruloyl esterase family alpha/beta hydrolase [Steroidobacter agaridevorans]GFE82432.1 putative esterase [Steroidobacter agaridevorans]